MIKRKMFPIVLALILSVALSGCRNVAEQKTGKKIVTSFYPMYIFTKNITKGTDAEVINMTAPQTGCLHDYQLLPKDIKKLEKSDIFIINGGGTESFMQKIYDNNKNLRVITASDGIPLLEEHEEHGHFHDENEEVGGHLHNSHVWTYIPNAISEIKNITEGLCAADYKNAGIYRENSEKYIEKLENLHSVFEEKTAELKSRRIIVTGDAFEYLADGYGFEIAGVLETEHNSAPSANELKNICDIAAKGDIPLFKTPDAPENAVNTISRETKCPIYELDPFFSGNSERLDAYENAMNKNLNTLCNALKNN